MATCVWREGGDRLKAEIRDHGERVRTCGVTGRKHTSLSFVCACVWRKSRKLLTGRYAEREISMITPRERRAEEMRKSQG